MVDSTRAQKNYPGQKSLSSQAKGKEFEKLLHMLNYDLVKYMFSFFFQFSIALQYFAGKCSILNIHFKCPGLDENTNPKRDEAIKIHEETETSGKFLKLFQKHKEPFIIYTSGGHRREIKKSIYKKITQPLWVFNFFYPTSIRNPRF